MKKIIAHRGVFNNIDIPENSIKSFKEALKLNIDVEFDIQLTKDNVLVIFHDDNLKRMTGIDKNIQECNYDEIKNLKLLNTNEYIPTLDEVLKLINDKVFMDIEIKNIKRIKDTCSLLVNKLNKYKKKILKLILPSKFIIKYSKCDFISINKNLLNKNKFIKLSKIYPTQVWTITDKNEVINDEYTYICNNIKE